MFWQGKLDDIQTQLQSSPLDAELHGLEKDACFHLKKWQRYFQLCVKNLKSSGLRSDLNTRYFHSVVKERTSHNKIDFLKDGNGCLVTDQKQIASIIVDYYQGLLGTSADTLLGIDIQGMRDGPQISHEQALNLIRPITPAEVEVGSSWY